MSTSRDRIGRRTLAAGALAAAGLALALAAGGCCTASLLFKSCTPADRLVLTAAPTLNACDPPRKPVSHPVIVRIYALKKADAFQEADFDAIWDEQALAADLAAPAREVTLAPGAAPLTLTLPRPAGTVALGIVAGFCRLESGCWRKTITLDKGAADVKLALEGTCLKLTP